MRHWGKYLLLAFIFNIDNYQEFMIEYCKYGGGGRVVEDAALEML